MNWKTALTAEEAALIAVGYVNTESFDAVQLPMPNWMYDEPRFSRDEWEFGEAQSILDEETRLHEQYDTAQSIYQALLQEIPEADPLSERYDQSRSLLEIFNRAQVDELDNGIVCEKTTLTKQSLARWFWQHDHEVAKLFWPSINEENASNLDEVSRLEKPKPLSTKSKNAYLKTIEALAAVLLGGSTGMPSKDAGAILEAIDLKGIPAPVSQKTLAGYLDEARNL